MDKKTQSVIDALRAERPENPSPAFWTDGIHAYSYNTCILARIGTDLAWNPTYVMNFTRYSPTTHKYQSAITRVFSTVTERICYQVPRDITAVQLIKWRDAQ